MFALNVNARAWRTNTTSNYPKQRTGSDPFHFKCDGTSAPNSTPHVHTYKHTQHTYTHTRAHMRLKSLIFSAAGQADEGRLRRTPTVPSVAEPDNTPRMCQHKPSGLGAASESPGRFTRFPPNSSITSDFSWAKSFVQQQQKINKIIQNNFHINHQKGYKVCILLGTNEMSDKKTVNSALEKNSACTLAGSVLRRSIVYAGRPEHFPS